MNLCVIPARGGSKRIPRKNIKLFNDKPIIAYSIESAIQSKCFDNIIVSTDDLEIAEIAKQYGAEVPFLRPEELSNDHAATIPVINHAIDYFTSINNKPNNVCCIYATAPFVSAKSIKKAYQLLIQEDAGYCFTATSFPFPIQRAMKVTKNNRLEMFQPENFNVRSQDLEEAYHDAGQFYWGKANTFLQEKPLFSDCATPYILPRHLVQDIDTPEDWVRAELMYQVLERMGEL